MKDALSRKQNTKITQEHAQINEPCLTPKSPQTCHVAFHVTDEHNIYFGITSTNLM